YTLKLPAGAPAGQSNLTVSYSGGKGFCPLGAITVGAVERAYNPPTVVTPLPAAASTFGKRLATLYGYTLAPGSPTSLRLVWQSLSPTDNNYSVFVHVIDVAGGGLVVQAAAEPRVGTDATSL